MAENYEGDAGGYPSEVLLETAATPSPNYVNNLNGLGGTPRLVDEAGNDLVTDSDAGTITVPGGGAALSAGLDAVNGLTPSANTFAYWTAATTAALATVTAFARTVLDDANSSTARTTLGLGTTDTPTFDGLTLGATGFLTLPYFLSLDGTATFGVLGDLEQSLALWGAATFGFHSADAAKWINISDGQISSEWAVYADTALGASGYSVSKLTFNPRQRTAMSAFVVARGAAHEDRHVALTTGINFHQSTVQPLVTPGSALVEQFEHEFDSGAGSGYGEPTHTLRPDSMTTPSAEGPEVYCDATGTSVTGINSKFLSDIRPGDAISIGGSYSGVYQGTYSGGVIRTVSTVSSDTALTVASAFPSPLTSERCAVGSFVLTGTVSVTINTTAVTGVGTDFGSQFGGDTGFPYTFDADKRPRIHIAGESHYVASVESDTALTLAYAHTTGASGVAYRSGGLLQNEWWLGMNDIRPFGASALAQYPEDLFTLINGSLGVYADERCTIQALQNGHLVRIQSEVVGQPLVVLLEHLGTTGTGTAAGAYLEFKSTGDGTFPSRILFGQNIYNAAYNSGSRNSIGFYTYHGAAGAGPILHLDAENRRVGVANNAPTTALDVTGTVKATEFEGGGSGLTGLGLTVGSTTIASGTDNKILYQDGTTLTQSATSLTWDESAGIFAATDVHCDELTVSTAIDANLTGGGITLNSFTTGNMNNVVIGATTPAAGTFTTLTATTDGAAVTLSPSGSGTVTISPGGNVTVAPSGIVSFAPTSGNPVNIQPATGNVLIAPGGSGTITLTSAGTGEINNMNIGAATRGSGAFTTLAANGLGTFSAAGAASTPALLLSGVPFSGTGTTSFPLLYINDANATASTSLNTAGTYFGVNGDGSQDLANFLKDGTSQFRITAASGVICSANINTSAGNLAASASAGNLLIGGSASGNAATLQKMQKKTSSIADATATTVLTITVPNGSHSASIRVRVCGSLGAGGAIGANEASQTLSYDIGVSRVAGVAMNAVISSAYGDSGSVAVAGATTVTVSAALTLNAEGVGVTNTASLKVTITKGGGSSANHTCLVSAECHNNNSSGITIS